MLESDLNGVKINFNNSAGVKNGTIGITDLGVIESILMGPDSQDNLIAPSYAGESTDRVIQWTLWINSLKGNPPTGDPRFNVTQAGTADNLKNTLMNKLISTDGFCEVTIDNSHNLQWNPQLRETFQQDLFSRTVYRFEDYNKVKVNRYLYLARLKENGLEKTSLTDIYWEAWTPLRKQAKNSTDIINQILIPKATKSLIYRNNELPYYPFWLDHLGLLNLIGNSLNLNISFGINRSENGGLTYLNSMDFNSGFFIGPAFSIGNMNAGDMLVQIMQLDFDGNKPANPTISEEDIGFWLVRSSDQNSTQNRFKNIYAILKAYGTTN